MAIATVQLIAPQRARPGFIVGAQAGCDSARHVKQLREISCLLWEISCRELPSLGSLHRQGLPSDVPARVRVSHPGRQVDGAVPTSRLR